MWYKEHLYCMVSDAKQNSKLIKHNKDSLHSKFAKKLTNNSSGQQNSKKGIPFNRHYWEKI